MKRPSLLTPLPLLLLTAFSITPLRGAGPDLSKYPLRIKVLAEQLSTPGGSGDPHFSGGDLFGEAREVSPSFSGSGQADLVDATGAQAIDFKYYNCPDRVTVTKFPLLAARWTKPGKHLEVLFPDQPTNPRNTHFTPCTLNVVLNAYAYVRGLPGKHMGPNPDAVSLEDYQKSPYLRTLAEGVRKKTATEYVSETALHITWNPITTVPDAPFTATVVTELTQHLPDGTTRVLKSHRLIARDSAGRVFEEQRNFTPDGDTQETPLLFRDYAYPEQHLLSGPAQHLPLLYRCDPVVGICTSRPYNNPATLADDQSATTAAVQTEDLGQKKIDNLDMIGTRRIRSAGGGPQQSIEAWFSPQLKIDLIESRTNTRTGDALVTVNDLNLSEPDPTLFLLPKGYMVDPGLLPNRQLEIPVRMVSSVKPLSASGPNAIRYALHVNVLSSNTKSRVLHSFRLPDNSGHFHGVYPPVYYGQIQAVLLDSAAGESVNFTYDDCPSPIRISDPQHPLAARWTKSKEELEVLVPVSKPGEPIDFKKDQDYKCTLKAPM